MLEQRHLVRTIQVEVILVRMILARHATYAHCEGAQTEGHDRPVASLRHWPAGEHRLHEQGSPLAAGKDAPPRLGTLLCCARPLGWRVERSRCSSEASRSPAICKPERIDQKILLFLLAACSVPLTVRGTPRREAMSSKASEVRRGRTESCKLQTFRRRFDCSLRVFLST